MQRARPFTVRRAAAATAPARTALSRYAVRAGLPLVGAGVLLAGATPTAPAEGATTRSVLALGDSVAAGSVCRCRPFPVTYAAALGRAVHAPVGVTNLARPGYVSGDVRRQVQDPAVAAAIRAATTVLVMVGANDFGPSFAQASAGRCAPAACHAAAAQAVTANVAAVLARVRAVHPTPVTIVVLGYWNVVQDGRVGRAHYGPVGVAAARTATSYANAALRRVAAAASARYVSTYVPFKGRDGRRDPTPLLAADGDHPNARGHARIAKALLAAVPRG